MRSTTSAGLNAGTRDPFLITFCNQRPSPFHSLCVMELHGGSARWIDLTPIPETQRESFAGLCGICSVGDHAVVATQGTNPGIALVNLHAGTISTFAPLAKCKDTHSVVFHSGYVYAVSTGTNEVYRIPFQHGIFGAEELYWQYPGVRYDSDEIHLNGLSIDNGDNGRLIASCFGSRSDDRSWASNGRVFYLDTGQDIHDRLSQPHSPLVVGDRLFLAESAGHKVHAYVRRPRGGWAFDKEIQFDGYTRGLAFKDGRLLVGLSASRTVSRSKKTLNNLRTSIDAAIVTVDLATGKQVATRTLVNFGREIYAVIPTTNSPSLAPEHEAITSRVRELEATVDRYAADVGWLWLQTEDLRKTISDKDRELWQLRSRLEGRDSPRVSVIIPTYNRGRFILEAIDSVLSQEYPNFELIVVDDGSTDNTAAVVGTIDDPRLRYIQQNNHGRSNARNRALSLANGDFITFLDSDDLYLPGKISLQVEYLLKHPETGMLYTSAYCIDGEGNMLQHKYEATVSGMIYEQIAFFQPVTITLPTVMARREVFAHVGGFDEKMHRFEDTDMWRRISKSYRIDALPIFSCKLRTHDDNSLRNQNPEQIVAALKYYSQKITKEDVDINPNIRNAGLARLYRYYGAAMMTVPALLPTGIRLMRTALKFDWEFVLRARIVRYARAVRLCFHSLYWRVRDRLRHFYHFIKRAQVK